MKLIIPTLIGAATAYSTCQSFMSGSFGEEVNNEIEREEASIGTLADLVANLEVQARGSEMDDTSLGEDAPQKNRVIILLDKSGSMSSIQQDTIDAFNTLLASLKETEAAFGIDTKFSLVTFSSDSSAMSADSISATADLSSDNYNPNGGTALYDTLGCTLDALAGESQNMLYIITDGEENGSYMNDAEGVAAKVESALNDRLWEMAYLGSNENAEEYAKAVGINRFISFEEGTSVGIQNAMEEVGEMVSKNMHTRSRNNYRRRN